MGEPKVEVTTKPVDAVIKVGQKDYTGTITKTIKKEIPFEVKIVENPDLEAGKSNVKQEGKAGSRTYVYSGEIFNGGLKEGAEFTRTELEDQYVAPTVHIIEVGTKPAENQVDIDKTVDVKVEYKYDYSKPKDYLEVGELVPGRVITTVKNRYNPETGQIESVKETTVTPGTRIVTRGAQDYTGTYEEEHKEIIPYETEIFTDPNLPAGTSVVAVVGQNGEKTTTITRHIENGEIKSSDDPVEVITQEAKNQVIRVGTKTDGSYTYTEKIPFETKEETTSDLKKGEWRYKRINGEEQKGKAGTRTTTWNIVNSRLDKDNPSIDEEKPVNATIEVGDADFTGNVSHFVTEEIPFEVVIEEDPTMTAGTSEIVTPGVAGSKTTKYIQGIKNGAADGDLQSTVTATTNAINQVIKVGTKPAENNKDLAKDVGVRVEYEYNKNLKKGIVQVGDLTPGKVETKIVNKYDPKAGQITTTEEEIVTEAVQKIIVGTGDFTGSYQYEKTTALPFEVVITEDPKLAKGEMVVDQVGVAGFETTYYEQAFRNGEKEGDAKLLEDKTRTVSPKNHIVRVGTKPAEGSTVKVVEREIPYETKVVYDDTLDAGTRVVENEGKAGKETVTVTTKITDGTGEVSEEVTKVRDKVDREIRIGVKSVTREEAIPQGSTYKHNPELEAGTTKLIEAGTPGTNDPSKPGKEDPNKPGKVNPEKPVDNHGSNTCDKQKTDHNEERRRMTPAANENGRKAGNDGKAPQTFDPGIAAPTGLAALASGLFLGLERLKRRNKK